ncbi:ABC transporter ATP-binding protein [Paenibacillus sp. FSL P4-0338]|uniref:ABC transporter ATP-binding protein n=1 Tax=unclassified Paenibacillus TaxID=185978 RepID=UPI0003E212F0|nr:ABC transporter ATP-binding protein [Paenibacillus sp. FSL R7-269]ETT44677.1 subtilin transport ATP-binding protein SpaT [Paenibacillus sp. FSL R7-269]
MKSEKKNNQQGELKSLIKTILNGLRLFKLIFKLNKHYMVPSIIINIVQGFLPVAVLLVTQNLLNGISTVSNRGEGWLLHSFLMFSIVYFIKVLISGLNTYVEGNLQSQLSNTMNILICEKSVKLGLEDYENSEINDQLKRATQEASYRPYELYNQITSIITSIITLISSAIILIMWKWWIIIIIVISSTISIYSILKINREQFQIHMDRVPLIRRSWYLTYLLTNDRAVKEVKIFQLAPYLLDRYRNFLKSFFQTDRKMLFKRVGIVFLYDVLELISLCVLIWIALFEAFMNRIQVGSLYGYIQAITLTQSQMTSIIQGLIRFSQNNLYMEQMLIFLELPTTDPIYVQKNSSSQRLNLEKEINTISMENIYFRYAGKSHDVIQNFNLKLNKGETIAIVGKNGSGKSSLVKLLMQLYGDYRGRISINGVDIKEYDLQQIQERIGVVFQDFMQYEMSARHNIGFGSLKEMDDEIKVMTAAQKVLIETLIKQLPKGIDTQLGKWFEEGYQLSGGQWQRIAIARAFMRNADIYILDEPSSFLDPIAEKELLEIFMELMKDKIGIFITHRITSARLAQKIIVMEEGQIIEQGSHLELMMGNGMYAEMYRIQVSSFSDKEEGVQK